MLIDSLDNFEIEMETVNCNKFYHCCCCCHCNILFHFKFIFTKHLSSNHCHIHHIVHVLGSIISSAASAPAFRSRSKMATKKPSVWSISGRAYKHFFPICLYLGLPKFFHCSANSRGFISFQPRPPSKYSKTLFITLNEGNTQGKNGLHVERKKTSSFTTNIDSHSFDHHAKYPYLFIFLDVNRARGVDDFFGIREILHGKCKHFALEIGQRLQTIFIFSRIENVQSICHARATARRIQ